MKSATFSILRISRLVKGVLFSIAGAGLFLSTASASLQSLQDCGDTRVLLVGNTNDENFGITGSIAGTTALANTTIYWDVAQTNAGVLGFSTSRNGPFTATIKIPMTLDGIGSGQATYFVKGLSAGHTVIVETSPQCGGGTVQCGGVVPLSDYAVKGCACPPIPSIP